MPKQFKFGDKVKNVFASERNPQRNGIFVRYVGAESIEVTDGKGDFWVTCRRSTVPEDMPEAEAKELEQRLWEKDWGKLVR